MIYNAQSLLQAREKFFSNINEWYSFKPPEYKKLRNTNPIEQVVGQVYYTNMAVEEGLKNLPSDRFITLQYETFCVDQNLILAEINKKTGIEIQSNPFKLISRRTQKVDDEKWRLLMKYTKKYE
jgi:hypothetical protein